MSALAGGARSVSPVCAAWPVFAVSALAVRGSGRLFVYYHFYDCHWNFVADIVFYSLLFFLAVIVFISFIIIIVVVNVIVISIIVIFFVVYKCYCFYYHC